MALVSEFHKILHKQQPSKKEIMAPIKPYDATVEESEMQESQPDRNSGGVSLQLELIWA